MSNNTSPFVAFRHIETLIRPFLRQVDVDELEQAEKQATSSIKQLMVDARLDIRDYELSETRDEQLQNAVEAKNRLFKLQAAILLAGPVFGPADVAQLTAQLDQINGWLV